REKPHRQELGRRHSAGSGTGLLDDLGDLRRRAVDVRASGGAADDMLAVRYTEKWLKARPVCGGLSPLKFGTPLRGMGRKDAKPCGLSTPAVLAGLHV